MTIELEGGYTSTIPHYELVWFERGTVYSDLGEYGVTNTSRIMASFGNGMTDYGENFGILLGGVSRGDVCFRGLELSNLGTLDVRKMCSLNTSVSPSSPIRPNRITTTIIH